MKNSWKKILIVLFLPLGFIINKLLNFFPLYVEKIYSTKIYRCISLPISIFMGLIPISVGELLFYTVVVLLLWQIIKILFILTMTGTNKLNKISNIILNICIFISIIYTCFLLMWGLNYNRLTFDKIAKLNIKATSINKLEDLCYYLIKDANNLRKQVAEDSKGLMYIPSVPQDVFLRANLGYEKTLIKYPKLAGKYGVPKPILLSKAMSVLGVSGIFCPFTIEANVNTSIPHSLLPATTCHEMAHQRGFAREDEANFIAYITCKMHPDSNFKYSGTLLALIYSMNALSEHDTDRHDKLVKKFSKPLLRDINYINDYWKSYEGPIEKTSNRINDVYLKSNNQKNGVDSYGKMVDLLLAYYLSN